MTARPSARTLRVALGGLDVEVLGPASLLRQARGVLPLAPADAPGWTPAARFSLRHSATGVVVLDSAGRVLVEAADEREAAGYLEWAVATAAVEHLRGRRLLFHAAVVSLGGLAAVLPAASGSGKTTLVAGLAAAGATCYSDEVAVVDPAALRVESFRKLLRVKVEAVPVLASRFPALRRARPRRTAGDRLAVYLPLPGDGTPLPPLAVGWVIVPRYVPDVTTALTPLSRAEALRALLDQAFNGDNLGAEGTLRTVALVRGAACFRLWMGSLESAVAAVLGVLRT